MKCNIVGKEVDYCIGLGNSPRLFLIVENLEIDSSCDQYNYEPDKSPYIWKEYENGLISFLVYGNPVADPRYAGFGGKKMEFTLTDGSRLKSNNWWSGGAYGLNTLNGIECVDITIKTTKGSCLNGLALTLDKAKEIFCDEEFIIEHIGIHRNWTIKKPE